jgi:cytochrome c553
MRTLLVWALATGGLAVPLVCAAQDSLLGRNLAATCANCHGTNGQSKGEVPSLAGLPAERIATTMAAFKNGAQPSTIMQQIAKGYTDDQVKAVAAYFAAQPAPR